MISNMSSIKTVNFKMQYLIQAQPFSLKLAINPSTLYEYTYELVEL